MINREGVFMINRVGKFEKVSFEEFFKAIKDIAPYTDESEETIREMYEKIQLPTRATSGSMGNDFRLPYAVYLEPGETEKIPTGIRVYIEEGWGLACYPRSGLGFKYRVQLDNTVGLIDSDYYYSDNEGHIFAKITNDSKTGKSLALKAGDSFMQGVFTPYGITYDDDVKVVRNGGFGSTSK